MNKKWPVIIDIKIHLNAFIRSSCSSCIHFICSKFVTEVNPVSRAVSYTRRSHLCGELTKENVGQEVTLCGWIQYHRFHGLFLILRDWSGIVQVVLSEKVYFCVKKKESKKETKNC